MHYIFICWFHDFIHQNKLMNFIDQNSSQSEWLKITTRKNAVFGHLFKFDNNLLSQGCTFFDIRFYYQILPFNYHCFHHIETSQLVYRANQLTGFYMMGTLVVKRLREERLKPILLLVTQKKADRPCLKFSLKPNIRLQQVSRSPISKSTLS